MAKRVILYARTVADTSPTIDDQLDLLQQVAAHQGWTIIATHTDTCQIGTRGRDRRPGLDALLRGVSRREYDVVATHSLCRLGRSLQDLLRILGELRARDVDLLFA